MKKTIAAIAVAAIATTAPMASATTIGSGKKLIRAWDAGTDSAQIDGKRTWKPNKRHKRIKVLVEGTAVVNPYYYTADTYDKVQMPTQTVQFRDQGWVSVECKRRGQKWYEARTRTRTVITNTIRTVKLPIRNAHRCRVEVSLSAWPTDSDMPDLFPAGTELSMLNKESVTLTATVKATR